MQPDRKTSSLGNPRRSKMKFVKRKKPSHDIFNRMYMEDMIGEYESFVKKVSANRIYHEIIPKKHRRAYCGEPFGEAFNKTCAKTFSKTVGRIFDNTISCVHDNNESTVKFDEEYNIDPPFEMIDRYNLAEPLTKQSCEQKRWHKEANKIILESTRKIEIYSKMKNLKKITCTVTKMFVNNACLYQGTLEYAHLLYTMNKYKILSENASNDVKATFRQRELAAKNRYIEMLENMLCWKDMEQKERIKTFTTTYNSQLQMFAELKDEAQWLRNVVRPYENDKEGSKRAEALTGFTTKLRNIDWVSRSKIWEAEIDAMEKQMAEQLAFYTEEDKIQSLESNIRKLCESAKTRLDQMECHLYFKETALRDLYSVWRAILGKQVENIFLDFCLFKNTDHHKIATTMKKMNTRIKMYTDRRYVKTKNQIQEQERKIDQLEMKIIRHVIKSKTARDVRNEEHGEANSNDAVTNDTSSDAPYILRVPNIDGSSRTRESDKHKISEENKLAENLKLNTKYTTLKLCKMHNLERLQKLDKILATWLKKKKPDEKKHKRYEMIFNAMVDDLVKLRLEEESSNADEEARMEKATGQMIHLVNKLKLEFAQVDANLTEIACKVRPFKDKYSKSRADSAKKCDTCRYYRSNIIDCTKYITRMLCEENLNKYYVLTTVMDQLSFLLYMMRTSIFADGMSRRKQWPIKKMKSKIIAIRIQLRKILGVKIDTINFSLTKDIDTSFADTKDFAKSCDNVCTEQSNDKDMSENVDCENENNDNESDNVTSC